MNSIANKLLKQRIISGKINLPFLAMRSDCSFFHWEILSASGWATTGAETETLSTNFRTKTETLQVCFFLILLQLLAQFVFLPQPNWPETQRLRQLVRLKPARSFSLLIIKQNDIKIFKLFFSKLY